VAQIRTKLFTSFGEINKNKFYFYRERLLYLVNYDKKSALKLSAAVYAVTHFVGIRFIKLKLYGTL